MKARTILARGAVALALAGGSLLAIAPAAQAQTCVSTTPGYARQLVRGVAVYVEDARCGRDPNRPDTPSTPAKPKPNQPNLTWGCRPYPDGELLCGDGISNSGRTPLSHDTWRRLYGSPPPTGTVRVGAPISVGGGGGSVRGTVTVGTPSNPDKDESEDTSDK